MTAALDRLPAMVLTKRGSRPLRATAADLGISPATLNRVENGGEPDLNTFAILCRWLGADAGELLGFAPRQQNVPGRRSPDAQEDAGELAKMILQMDRASMARDALWSSSI